MSLSLPEANITKVIGLLQILSQRGGEHETASLASDLQMHAEHLLPVTEAAELLGFVTISGGRIRLTNEGKKAISGGIPDRRHAVKERLLTLPIFKKAIEVMSKRNRKVSKRALHKALLADLPKQQADRTMKCLIAWGRHASLVGYNADTDELFLID